MNLDKYRNERRQDRTQKVKIQQLATYFDEGQEPVFVVRGLTGAELGHCKEAAARQRNTAAMAAALIGGDAEQKSEALKELANGPEVPDDIVQRLEMLAVACVEPQLTHGDAKLICDDFPAEFYQLTNAITNLTGAGRVLGKPSASGATQE
jgi:hypothetical protein